MHAGRLGSRLGMLAGIRTSGMHALTARAITHDSTTFETIPNDSARTWSWRQLQQPLVFMLKTHSTTQNPTTSTGRTLQLAGHTGSHPGTPFEVCPSRITAQTGHKVHKGSASTDGTVTMPTHGATKPSACKNSTVRQLSLHNSTWRWRATYQMLTQHLHVNPPANSIVPV